MQILLVDDEDIFRCYLRQALEWQKYGALHFLEADNGKAAISIAEKTHLDLVLADIEMPMMNGLDCAAAIRQLQPDCEVVLISAHDQFVYAQTALKIGIADFLVKPVDAQTLTACMDRVMDRIVHRQAERRTRYLEDGLAGAERFSRDWGFLHQRGEDPAPANTPHGLRWELSKALSAGDSEAVFHLLDLHISNIQSSGLPMEGMKNQGLGLAALCLDALKHAGIAYDAVFSPNFSPYSDISAISTPGELRLWLEDLFRRTLDGLTQKQTTHAQRLAWEARRSIEKNYADSKFNIVTLAKSLYVTEAYIRKLFKMNGWSSPSNYLKEVRMEAALALIRDERRSVAEAAELVGFQDPAYFSKCFKARYGCSPSYYEDPTIK